MHPHSGISIHLLRMNKLHLWLIPSLTLVFFIFLALIFSSHTAEVQGLRSNEGAMAQHIAPTLPSTLSFAGENVPLEYFWVTEGLDRELLVNIYWHSSTIMLIKRANRYFPVIEPILKQQGVPDDFKYLAVIESNLLPAISPAGAAGIWQFLKKTGQEYGLVVVNDVDERYHLEKATVAACRYLREARDTFGSWTLAAAAYNAGIGGIKRSLAEQKGESYYDLWLNTETSRYVHRILALKMIFENPEQYGYTIDPATLYVPVKVRHIPLNQGIDDLAAYALSHGISYRALKELNPWMRTGKLPPPQKEPYSIALPEDAGRWYPR